MRIRTVRAVALGLLGVLTIIIYFGHSLNAQSARVTTLDVNDVSILFPPPTTAADLVSLVSADEALDNGAQLWPKAAFDQVIGLAQTIGAERSGGGKVNVDFSELGPSGKNQSSWKVVGVRVDPAAPGTAHDVQDMFGVSPQIRLILQPVTVDATGSVQLHDFTAHLVYDYVLDPTPASTARGPLRAVPNRPAFLAIVNDLQDLKRRAGAASVTTGALLSIHPALRAKAPGFAEAIRSMLKRQLPKGTLRAISFMGVPGSEPWVFFATSRLPNGTFSIPDLSALSVSAVELLTFSGGDSVAPEPKTRGNIDSMHSVSTAKLFDPRTTANGQRPAFIDLATPQVSDIPDIVANPLRSNFFNTDCVSCHSESVRRRKLNAPSEGQFQYKRSAAISGVDSALLPGDDWNVRNFGWSPFEPSRATITMRTANETAEAAAFINHEYLGQPSSPGNAQPTPVKAADAVSHPLTLVMDIRPAEVGALRAQLEGMQGAPPGQNPITTALDALGNVHYARFVFLNDHQLAVITTFDGAFDAYINSFVNSIGKIFDAILAHVVDAPPLPVSEHRAEFLSYVQKHDIPSIGGQYSAYPALKVQDVLTLQKKQNGGFVP